MEPISQPTIRKSTESIAGLLFIGDPHVEGRTPGFRKDDYPQSILNKLVWIMDYAEQHQLQPVLLGDVFDKPRDNPNWLLSKLLDLFARGSIPTIYGNHDCANPALDENDSLMLLAKAGAVYLLDSEHLWMGSVEGRTVVLGGSPYRHPIPERFVLTEVVSETSDKDSHGEPLVIWITHHDLAFPTNDDAVVTDLYAIPGIHYVINGHIHRRAPTTVERDKTIWVNPGNISRRSRTDAIRGHVPAVLRMDITSDGQWLHYVDVPHQLADEVFFDLTSLENDAMEGNQSSFVTGLALLQSRKTYSGAGLMEFLRENVVQFEPDVASEILQLAQDVLESNKE
jgi:DNA repair exonuclease SbcCD nuclease subunit